MKFEWDDARAAANLAKHGIDFETAARVFGDPLRLAIPSRRNGEPREKTIGRVGEVLVVAVSTLKGMV
ncbi:MAG: BrnT family toxin [Opitutaceae bacterium]|jgi:uncharacterized DUF497 family protein|nr:BrnT family toxin [Opitutaceae bacterium]